MYNYSISENRPPIVQTTASIHVNTPVTTQTNSGVVVGIPIDLENECAICLEFFDAGEYVRVLDCGHYYHQKCVDTWLQREKQCPKCNGENNV